MKLKRPIKIAGLLILFLVSILPVEAQGVVHLGPGGSYLFSQPIPVEGKIDELGATSFEVRFGFAGDLFAVGDSLRVDILSTPTSLIPLATGTTSNPPWINQNVIRLVWTGTPWNAGNGAVRLTMLNGSVDVTTLDAITVYQFTRLFYSFPVPEPGSASLLLFTGAVLGGARWFGRLKRRTE